MFIDDLLLNVKYLNYFKCFFAYFHFLYIWKLNYKFLKSIVMHYWKKHFKVSVVYFYNCCLAFQPISAKGNFTVGTISDKKKFFFSFFLFFLSRTWKLFWLKKKKVLLCCCCTWLWRETKINKAYFLLVCLLKRLLNNNFGFLWRCVLLFYCGIQV